MANLTQTAANVQLMGSAGDHVYRLVTYGATIQQGDAVYEDTTDNEYKLADADTESTAKAKGVALTPGADGEPGIIAESGPIDVGATLVIGQLYGISTTAGAIAPIGDLGTGDFETILGRAIAADSLDLNIDIATIAKA